MNPLLRRIRNSFFVLLIFLYMIFEELIWKSAVAPIIRFINAFHLYRRFLDYIQFQASPLSVLILFMVPFAVGEVIGTLSAILAAQLHLLSAGLLYTMKIPLIVVALGILQHGKEKLLSYRWFALCYGWVMTQLDRLHSSLLYQQVHSVLILLRNRFSNRSSHLKRWIIRVYRLIRYSRNKS
ncbi:hypothetical protein [Sulfuricurvum sp.]|uniref:hypothetical protein n=1 Tax=Sulfuricurvum sp. TaxID=2025608 RepID=UPI002D4BDB10|nr:hypothetical protein [Sulfuricurvum sp.]HZF70787.1 hypothetical protein [Sulfuricurvum sp.]